MPDYKDTIIKHYALKMSGCKIASPIGASKSGVNEFLKAFEECEKLQYPLPPGITNYGIAVLVYGNVMLEYLYSLPLFLPSHFFLFKLAEICIFESQPEITFIILYHFNPSHAQE